MTERRPKRVRPRTRLQRLGVTAAALMGVLVVGGGLFVWSGLYNVSARQDHLGATTWLLAQVRDRSISAHSRGISAPDTLDDPDMIALGAEHYAGGCAFCHGEPGEASRPVAEEMLPHPPNLANALEDYPVEGVYWVVQNGLKYTGMPAWPAENRDAEVWSVVAFLKHLHEEGAEAYDSLVARTTPAPVGGSVPQGDGPEPLTDCVRCHGDAQTAPLRGIVPSLHGQSEAYLERALIEYRAARRPSGIMEPVAHQLADADIAALADYYADLPPAPMAAAPDAHLIAAGREIAETGVPEQDVPACLSCHGATRSVRFPDLAGQPARYLATQLELWRRGGRDRSGYGVIMAAIADRLEPDQIEAVSAYFQSRAPQVTDTARPSVEGTDP